MLWRDKAAFLFHNNGNICLWVGGKDRLLLIYLSWEGLDKGLGLLVDCLGDIMLWRYVKSELRGIGCALTQWLFRSDLLLLRGNVGL